MLLCLFYWQEDEFFRRGGVHLCYLRHVLHTRQLCPLPHPGAGEQGQASAVCQWRQPGRLLAGQFCLGHGEWRSKNTPTNAVLPLRSIAWRSLHTESKCVSFFNYWSQQQKNKRSRLQELEQRQKTVTATHLPPAPPCNFLTYISTWRT